jgi:hypothetical protein
MRRLTILLVLGLAVAGCGKSGEAGLEQKESRPVADDRFSGQTREVAQTVLDLDYAMRHGDADVVCRVLVNPAHTSREAAAARAEDRRGCEQGLRKDTDIGSIAGDGLKIERLQLNGDRAEVVVSGKTDKGPTEVTLHGAKLDGGWRVVYDFASFRITNVRRKAS